MSGGHFDYIQHRLADAADSVESIYKHNYSDETIKKFKEAVDTFRLAEAMMQRVDWLLSGDDGEDCFHSRWAEEVEPLKKEMKL